MGYVNFELLSKDSRRVVSDWVNRVSIWHVVLFSAILRFFVMSFPSDGGMIFDEVHYIKATRALLSGVAANAEHPPLAKIIGMISFTIFGDHWFGWRIPWILFSLWATYLIYAIAKEFLDERLAVLASAFMIFDIIFFIHGNIYMLEISAFTLALASVLYYLRGRTHISAFFTGIAFLCNEKALFILLGLAIYHCLTQWDLSTISNDAKKVFGYLMICSIIGAGGLAVTDAIWKPAKHTSVGITKNIIITNNETGHSIRTHTETTTVLSYDYIENPIDHVIWMIQYYGGINVNLTTLEENFRPAWGWIAPLGRNWNNPPTYLSVVVTSSKESFYKINYRAQTPIFIWFMTLPIVALAFWTYKEKTSRFILAWIGGNFVPWFLWELQKMNMPFNHYFLLTIPAIVIGIPWFWDKIGGKYKYHAMIIHLVCTAIYFFAFFPVGLVR